MIQPSEDVREMLEKFLAGEQDPGVLSQLRGHSLIILNLSVHWREYITYLESVFKSLVS